MSLIFLATLLSGITVAVCIALVFMPAEQAPNLGKRMKFIQTGEHSRAEKQQRKTKSTKSRKTKRSVADEFRDGENSQSVRILRRGQEMLRMSDALQSSDLRLRLVQAGYRGMKPVATYIIFRFLIPPVIGIFFAVYIYFFFPNVTENTLRYIMSIMLFVVIGFYIPVMVIKNRKNKRYASIKAVYPDVLDLVMICTESGMSVELSLKRVSEEIGVESPVMQEEMELLVAELSYLNERRTAYENFARRIDLPQVRALTSMVIQAEQYGTPISNALRILSDESRDERRSEAERKAASLPSKLTVPLMLFFMPALFVVILTPAILQIMENF